MKVSYLYYLSKLWNQVAFFIMWLGWKMIWDQTGHNKDMLERRNAFSTYTRDIMTSF